jgi:hypothetical protein
MPDMGDYGQPDDSGWGLFSRSYAKAWSDTVDRSRAAAAKPKDTKTERDDHASSKPDKATHRD